MLIVRFTGVMMQFTACQRLWWEWTLSRVLHIHLGNLKQVVIFMLEGAYRVRSTDDGIQSMSKTMYDENLEQVLSLWWNKESTKYHWIMAKEMCFPLRKKIDMELLNPSYFPFWRRNVITPAPTPIKTKELSIKRNMAAPIPLILLNLLHHYDRVYYHHHCHNHHYHNNDRSHDHPCIMHCLCFVMMS